MSVSEHSSESEFPSGPVRRIGRSHRSLTGQVSSVKNAVANEHESSLERDLLVILEFDLNVNRYQVQPLRLRYHDAQRVERSYTPDVLIEYRRDIIPARWLKTLLCEVKFRADLKADWALLRPKFRASVAYARERGWRFKILTEREIRTPYLANAKFLRGYRRGQLNEEESAVASQMKETLFEMRATTPEGLIGAMRECEDNRAQIIPILWRLVATGRVGMDLGLPLTMQSPLWSLDPHEDLPRRLERQTAWA